MGAFRTTWPNRLGEMGANQPKSGNKSSRIASNWVRDEKLESALPNAPKITFGEVVVLDVVGQTHGLVTA
jgi:hypothetical protein